MKYIVYIYAMLVFLAMAGCSNDYIYPDTSNMPHGYSLELQKDLEDEWIKIAEEKGLDTRYEWRIELRELDKDGKVLYRGEPRTNPSNNLYAVDSIVYKCYTNPTYNETTPSHLVCKFKINKSFTFNKYYSGSNQIILSPGVDYSVIDPELGEKICYYGIRWDGSILGVIDEIGESMGGYWVSSSIECIITEKDSEGNALKTFPWRGKGVTTTDDRTVFIDVTLRAKGSKQKYGQATDLFNIHFKNLKLVDIMSSDRKTPYTLTPNDQYEIEYLINQ
jgi:hypothetical protein